ncbi:MAG: rhodanese-like domain-containing protein [Bacteriovoracaceae bacterium]
MEFFKTNWPLLLLACWFIYKWWLSRRIKKLLPELKAKGSILLDVRSEAEYNSAHAQGTINIPLNQLSGRLNELPKDKPIVVACASGTRSGMAKIMLKKNGYSEIYNLGSWANF